MKITVCISKLICSKQQLQFEKQAEKVVEDAKPKPSQT